MNNMFHRLNLTAWAVAGAIVSVRIPLGGGGAADALIVAGSWWLWFAGFAALTTAAVAKTTRAWAPLAVHSAAFLALNIVPRVFPLSLLRLGLDLLR